MNRKTKILSLTLLILFIFIFLAVVWVNADGYEIQVEIPGGLTKGTKVENIGDYIRGIFKFGLIAIGLVAFGAIVVGAIQYTVSAGNESQTKEGKDRILHGIYGVVLLLLSFLILNTINPDIIRLREPAAPTYEVTPIGGFEIFIPTEELPAVCKNCVNFHDKVCITTGYTLEDRLKPGISCGSQCYVHQDFFTKLCNLENELGDGVWYGLDWGKDWGRNLSWDITEAYPPSAKHQSIFHYTGCAIDVVLVGLEDYNTNPPSGYSSDRAKCTAIHSFMQEARVAGNNIVWEYTTPQPSFCSSESEDYNKEECEKKLKEYPYCGDFKGISKKYNSKATGNHFHITLSASPAECSQDPRQAP